MNKSQAQTQENLLKAFTGESQARNKYTVFAKVARKEGNEWIARVFEETADNERVHAEELYEMIKGEIKVTTDISIRAYDNTLDNLKMAAEGERYEWTTMYPDFEKVAKAEGDGEAGRLFGNLKRVEEKHEERYIIIARRLDEKTLYSWDTVLEWKCVNCGFIWRGKTPPAKCPVCLKPSAWFMPLGLIR